VINKFHKEGKRAGGGPPRMEVGKKTSSKKQRKGKRPTNAQVRMISNVVIHGVGNPVGLVPKVGVPGTEKKDQENQSAPRRGALASAG